MIDLSVNEKQLKRTIDRARSKKVIIPTFRQQKNPDLIQVKIKNFLLVIVEHHILLEFNFMQEVHIVIIMMVQ